MRSRIIGAAAVVAGATAPALAARDLSYYTRENCEKLNLIPKWADADYQPSGHFERLFKTPLALDLLAAAHSGNETGFEQITANWGCEFDQCYGTGCEGEIGFYGTGPKDPAGGGCPKGPIRVYEELACAIRLGLADDDNAFADFCGGSGDDAEGMFECLAFFANVVTETGAFAEFEERDPRPYCWNRTPGNSECCPASDHKPCMEDSDKELSAADYPAENRLWLTDEAVSGKCCSYHGRGPLQVSYEPNYRALSEAMLGDEKELWHYPYKLRGDSVAGWTAALWFWFNKHPSQVLPVDPDEADKLPADELQTLQTSPRERLANWRSGGGLPGAINVINGGECGGAMSTEKAFSRVSYFYAIAHRLNAVEPATGRSPYALPGTAECAQSVFCSSQFANPQSECAAFRSGVGCVSDALGPYVANISTPIGFYRTAIKLTASEDGATPVCGAGSTAPSAETPAVWHARQSELKPIADWETMLDVTVANVCESMVMVYKDDAGSEVVSGNSDMCRSFCWCDHSVWSNGCSCPTEDTLSQPCKAMAEWLSHPTPFNKFESEVGLSDYKGGIIHGRVGPGLVMAFNGNRGLTDRFDRLCYYYGGNPCSWNVALKPPKLPEKDIHGCVVRLPNMSREAIEYQDETFLNPKTEWDDLVAAETLKPGEFPAKLNEVLKYYDRASCPEMTGSTIVEKLFTTEKGELTMDLLFSGVFSGSDGFDNEYFDKENNANVNKNILGAGALGPQIVWHDLVCALQLGIPTDRDFFLKKFGWAVDMSDGSDVPATLTEEQRNFALFEVMAFFANVVKETGALGQAEEQDPREYCNYMGGETNPCCFNDWGNNEPCYTTTTPDNTIIPPEELRRALGTNATCCTYHGRGFLQVSYEKNYGDVGEQMLTSPAHGVSAGVARRFGLNFPQFVEAFGVTGWTASLLFWTAGRPCQFCEGREASTTDWNAPVESPHAAIQRFREPGYGLGRTFTIINGQECEAAFTQESDESPLGAHARLALFYNLAYRLNAKPPASCDHEGTEAEAPTVYPLPGTKECEANEWCRLTFQEVPQASANSYKQHSGGCWALTPQPADDGGAYWPVCKPTRFQGSTRYGSRLDTISFSMKKEGGSCTSTQFLSCGVKKLSTLPSMEDADFAEYLTYAYPALDHSVEDFAAVRGKTAEELCRSVSDKDTSNNIPGGDMNCYDWCVHPSGAGGCAALDPATCYYQGTGLPFIQCANKFLQGLAGIASDCYIDINNLHGTARPNGDNSGGEDTGSDTGSGNSNNNDNSNNNNNDNNNNNSNDNSDSGSSSSDGGSSGSDGGGSSNDSGSSGNDNGSSGNDSGSSGGNSGSSTECDAGCSKCVSATGESWNDEHCEKCAGGEHAVDWPCQTPGFCKCA